MRPATSPRAHSADGSPPGERPPPPRAPRAPGRPRGRGGGEPGYEGPERRSRASRWRRSLAAAAKSLPGIVALVTGAAALIYALAPGLRPDPRNTLRGTVEIVGSSTRCSATSDGSGSRISTGFPAGDPCGIGQANGYLVSVATEATGHKRRELFLRAAVLDARTDTRTSVSASWPPCPSTRPPPAPCNACT